MNAGSGALPMIALSRAGRIESVHGGHAVICDAAGDVVAEWGAARALIYPRSACKMVQALPLVESGAAAGLDEARLALACASHAGAARHVDGVARWLADMGLDDGALRCGAHAPGDRTERERLIRAGEAPDQAHNNCSGKHAGFLALAQHLRAGPEYLEIDHPVQRAVQDAFEEITAERSPGWGIDGCSAPNHACTLTGLARAMARFAVARDHGDRREKAMLRLREAMMARPDLVAGEGRACTDLMRAAPGQLAVKTGAEGVYTAILPQAGLGLALKIADGSTRAAEAALVALLAHLGVIEPAHPAALRRLGGPLLNWRGLEVGRVETLPGFP